MSYRPIARWTSLDLGGLPHADIKRRESRLENELRLTVREKVRLQRAAERHAVVVEHTARIQQLLAEVRAELANRRAATFAAFQAGKDSARNGPLLR